MLLIRTAPPRIFPKLNQTRQYLELFCAKEKISIIDVFYWYFGNIVRKNKVICELKKLNEWVIIVTNQLDDHNPKISSLVKHDEFKQHKIAKILMVDATGRVY